MADEFVNTGSDEFGETSSSEWDGGGGSSSNPVISITSPTTDATYDNGSTATIDLAGSATDDVAVTSVTWVNDRGGSGTATGTTSWTISGITLYSGSNVITVTAHDADSNVGVDTITVTYTPADTTAPVCTITSPTSSATYNNGSSSSINLGGTASDAVGVTSVTWSNNRGGSGTATGTTSWTISGITLYSGSNVITVTAHDAASNAGSDTITVTYTPADTTPPTCTITSPTSSNTYDNGSTATITLAGSASDNVAVTSVTWSNNRGGSGTASGTTSWNTGAITLYSGSNIITVTSHDAAGNTGTDSITVTYTPAPADTTAPTISITSPTSSASYDNGATSTITISGTASDNVAVTSVTWSNNRGGSGNASGTTSWTISNLSLYSGINIVTVTAHDAAGNTGTDSITVTYTPSVPESTGTVTYPVANYVEVVSPDVAFLLQVTPQKVLTETVEVNQEVFISDDGDTEEVLQYSADISFEFILQWEKLSDIPAATIWDCWISKANGYMYSFEWQHPLDGHIYVVKFDSNISRLFNPGITRTIPQIKLRVKGYVS